ncbi:hypothetical protein [Marinimicrococcus flavescens]|uniref:DUF2946 domain-containing protein n=1 Tax=Marinimicrococcus flavescens TaxID=3031815 RepID=A0AAP3UYV2_9PROT|nr:hypothetical protein [Marinimicrococcus flavescens]
MALLALLSFLGAAGAVSGHPASLPAPTLPAFVTTVAAPADAASCRPGAGPCCATAHAGCGIAFLPAAGVELPAPAGFRPLPEPGPLFRSRVPAPPTPPPIPC